MVHNALFLLAGQSSRFNGIVEHKCLLRLGGQTLLERQIISAANLGIETFVFATGAARLVVQQEVLRVLENLPYREIIFVNNERYATTNNAYTLWRCRHRCEGTTLVFEGDIVTKLPPLRSYSMPRWLVVRGFEGEGSFVVVDENDRIVDQAIFREYRKVEMGVYKSGGIFYLPKLPCTHPPDDVYVDALIRDLSPMAWYTHVGVWHEMDTVADYREAQEKTWEPLYFIGDPALR